MFLTRIIGRSFLVVARSRSTATAARSHFTATATGASTATLGHNPLEEFFKKEKTPDDQKPVYAIGDNTVMFLTRIIGRSFLAAARSQSTAAAARSHSTATAAGASTATSGHNPLEEFFEKERTPDDQKPVYGRSWKACELRLKSWDDLQKLWFVLLKEKNMLMTQRQMLHAQNLRFPNPERIPKVRKSMCRIKHVLTERAIDEADPRRSAEMKRMINTL